VKIIALISAYQEQDLLNSCIESAVSLDEIFVFDGAIGSSGDFRENRLRKTTLHGVRYWYYRGAWESDASKRTDMLIEAKAWNHDGWGLWLDGDEILLYGEYLRDHCRRADEETGTGGTTIRLVEYDASVAKCFGKLVRIGNIRRYILSSYEIELINGLTVAVPNVPICSAGGIPLGSITEREDPNLAINRPPLIGEPHLLHRHGLRSPKREAPRLHEKEAEDFQTLLEEGK
jgi:hypothetical protein